MSDYELDSQMRAMGVPMDQRKRIIAAAKLGVPNPLKQLGLSLPNAPPVITRSPSPTGQQARSRSPTLNGRAALPPSVPQLALQPAPAPAGAAVERVVRAPPRLPTRKKAGDEDEQDLDGFLARGRAATAAMAKAKAAERARQEQAAREQAERDRQRQVQLEKEREEERRRQQEEREREEEEKRKEVRRQARREEKIRRREQKKRQRVQEEDEDEEEAEDDSDEEDLDRRRRDLPAKGFFGQAYQGNQEQRKIWSEPIKGQVSNNYKGFTDADLDRRFGAPGGQAASAAAGPKLMTEEEVLALLRKGKSRS
mmetsp:Transcript_71415/g.202583  ORF Transcript_71415/g.202583 Transcript_71415/m.202583 type:complete len:311 (+) Transcript_71415:62-994(+)